MPAGPDTTTDTRLPERARAALPVLARALADTPAFDGPGDDPDLDALRETALLLLCRLLALAAAEGQGVLPRDREGRADAPASLDGLVERRRSGAPDADIADADIADADTAGHAFDDGTDYWDAVARLFDAVREGDPERGVPPLGGRLFAADPEHSPAGARLARVELPDAAFAPALATLLGADPPGGDPAAESADADGATGGRVPFERVDARELGRVHESLVGVSLAVADRDLTTDGEELVPAGPDDPVAVRAGDLHAHGRSGGRKASGSYYTRPRFVEHLLDGALDPAIGDHLARVERVREREGDAAASRALFAFRVADPAMGAGGFLVAALERVADAFAAHLDDRPLDGVARALDALADEARETHDGSPPTRKALLRRLVARHCCYGVDTDRLATDIARWALLLRAPVPGVAPTDIERGLRTGDSLAGVGRPATAVDALDDLDASTRERLLATIRAAVDTLAAEDQGARTLGDSGSGQRADPDRREDLRDRLRARLDVLAAARVDEEIDPAAVADPATDPCDLPVHDRSREALTDTDPLHFPAAFPEVFAGGGRAGSGDGGRGDVRGGFDVLLGNPPWEKAKLERHAFWARYAPGLRGLSQGEREAAIADLERDRTGLARRFEHERRVQERRAGLLTGGPYPGVGASDPDLYVAFAWRFWDLLRPGGDAGVVLPRPAFVGAATEDWRRRLLADGAVRDLTFLVNTGGWVFQGLHGQFTVALACFRRLGAGTDPGGPDPDGVVAPEARGNPDPSTLPIRGPFPDAERYERRVAGPAHEFDAADATRWTDTASFPVLPADPRAAGAFERLAAAPRLDRGGDDGGDGDDGEGDEASDGGDGDDGPDDWHLRPLTELHGTQDKRREDGTPVIEFPDDPPEGHRPVYSGGSFDLWDPDTGDYYGWADPDVVVDYLQDRRERSYRYAGSRSPFADLPESTVADPDTLRYWGPRLAYREVTNRTNRRTVVPALVPPRVVLNHKAPFFLRVRGDERDETYLLGVLASVPLDWYARRFVENTVSFYLLNAFPVPRPGRGDPRRERVVELAGRLAAVDDRYADWAEAVGVDYGPLADDERRAMVRELDAVVAHLYGLSREQVAVVFETFHENWDPAERLAGVLDAYDQWADRR